MVIASETAGQPKRILLATDLSGRCDRALDRAAGLAAQWSAQLIVVHAMEFTVDSVMGSPDAVPSWRQTHDLQKLAEWRVRDDIIDVEPRVEVVVEQADPVDLILRTAEAKSCDLIVTGVARDELLGRLLLGTTVDRLLKRATVPVLVARKRGRRPYMNIVVATDFSDPSRQAFEASSRMFPGRVPVLFHAYYAPLSGLITDTARHRRQFRDIAAEECKAFIERADVPKERGYEPEVVLEYGAPDLLLFDFVRDRDIDLLVLGTHGRSGLAEVFLGSAARRIVSAVTCDTLVVMGPSAARETA